MQFCMPAIYNYTNHQTDPESWSFQWSTYSFIDWHIETYIYICVCVCSKPCMEYASIYFVFNKYAKWTLRIYSISIFSQLYIVICDILARYASLHEMQYLFNISKHIDGENSGLGDVKNGKDLSKNKNHIFI